MVAACLKAYKNATISMFSSFTMSVNNQTHSVAAASFFDNSTVTALTNGTDRQENEDRSKFHSKLSATSDYIMTIYLILLGKFRLLHFSVPKLVQCSR